MQIAKQLVWFMFVRFVVWACPLKESPVFGLNQFSKRYMLHILARFTSYVNVLMGNPSHFRRICRP